MRNVQRSGNFEECLRFGRKREMPGAEAPGISIVFVRSVARRNASLRLLDLDLDIDACRKVETLKRINRLWRRLDDVEETLVDAHLEVLA